MASKTKAPSVKALQAKYPLERPTVKPFAACPMCGGSGERLDTRGLTILCGCTVLYRHSDEQKRHVMSHLQSIFLAATEHQRLQANAASNPKPKPKTKRK